MELDQLRYFLQVAERKSFTRAAADLSLSQPALSRSILKLEAEIGQPVFERRARSVVITDAGTLLRSRARQVLSILEDTLAEITDDGETGRVRIGAIPTVAPYFLPDILRGFADAHPGASLVVHENTTDALIKSCTQGDVDLAIMARPIDADALDVEDLFEEELFLVLPPDHALVKKREITLPDLEPHPFVLLDEAHCLSEDIRAYCRQRSFQPIAFERTSQLAMVQELVSLSHGISMIPAMARRLDQGQQRRVYRSMASPAPTRRLIVAWNPQRFQSRLVQEFRRFLKEHGTPPAGPRNAASTRGRARRRG